MQLEINSLHCTRPSMQMNYTGLDFLFLLLQLPLDIRTRSHFQGVQVVHSSCINTSSIIKSSACTQNMRDCYSDLHVRKTLGCPNPYLQKCKTSRNLKNGRYCYLCMLTQMEILNPSFYPLERFFSLIKKGHYRQAFLKAFECECTLIGRKRTWTECLFCYATVNQLNQIQLAAVVCGL